MNETISNLYDGYDVDVLDFPSTPEELMTIMHRCIYEPGEVGLQLAPELLEHRRKVHERNMAMIAAPPRWMTLKPEPKLEHLQTFIDEQFPYVDHLAKQAWMSLVQKSWGHFECNRILWHMWKDNERRKLDNDGKWLGSGKYMSSCCTQASKAIDNWQEWDYFNPDARPSREHHSSSSSSTTGCWNWSNSSWRGAPDGQGGYRRPWETGGGRA